MKSLGPRNTLRAGLALAVAGDLLLVLAAERINSISMCYSVETTCDQRIGQSGVAFVLALLLIGGSIPLLGADLGAGITLGGTFFGLGVGSLIAAVDGAGLGAWLGGVIFTVIGPLVGGLILGMTRTTRRAMLQFGAELQKSLPGNEEALRESGASGQATVLDLMDSGTTINDDPMVRFTVRISPADGSPDFTTHFTRLVSRLSIPRPGDQCPVRYDPENTERVLPIEPFSTGSATAEARSASAVAVDVVGALATLDELRLSKGLSESEYARLKARLLDQ
jgi:hypothetical protein